jgi:myo-inositol-1(or 4)-monophosphatase
MTRQLTAQEWLPILEGIAAEARGVAAPLLGTAGGVEVGTVGAGGDRTLEVDRQAEEAMLAGLRGVASRGTRFSVLSEEMGLIDLGAEYPRVVIDPIDGSPNAARGLRMVGLMLSLMTGPAVRDVAAGVTMDLTSGDTWTALRGGGAFREGRQLVPERKCEGANIDVLGLDALPADIKRAWPLLRRAATFRQFYCMSLSLVYTAAGGIDVFCSSRRARIFDLTAGLLTIWESGGVVTDLDGQEIEDLPVDLQTRMTLLCSAHADLHRVAVEHASEHGGGET